MTQQADVARNEQLRDVLHAVLSTHREELVQGLGRWLRDPEDDALWESELPVGQRVASDLVDAFLAAVLGGPGDFVRHVQRLAATRCGAGSGLRDLWLALTMLEDRIWRFVARSVADEDQTQLLGWVTQTVGSAKDRLVYLVLAQLDRAQARSSILEDSLALLSQGTEPAPEEPPLDAAVQGGPLRPRW